MASILAFANMVATIAVTLSLFGAPMAWGEVYQNDDYGVVASLPDDLPKCTARAGEANHGFALYLNTRDLNACGKFKNHRTIVLFTYFNVTEDNRLVDQSRLTCEGYTHDYNSKCIAGPTGLRLGDGPN